MLASPPTAAMHTSSTEATKEKGPGAIRAWKWAYRLPARLAIMALTTRIWTL